MKKVIVLAVALVMLSSMAPALYDTIGPQSAYAQVLIQASGATFAFPLLDLWRVQYQEVNPDVRFDYQSIGSGGGVKNHISKLGNFAATDAPLIDPEYAAAPGTITIPAMIGSVSIVYNIPGLQSGLNISEEALCGMYLGTVKSWNDPLIAEANPDVELPDEGIVIVRRSDGSGTTYALTSYLTKTCPEWDERVGAAKSVQWPAGVGSPGNEGVAGTIRTTEYSVGYVTLAYAFQNDMTTADIQNADKTNYVSPSIETASAASATAAFWLPSAEASWRDVDLLAAPGFDSYPITSFSYLIIHPELNESADSLEHAQAMVDLIAWMITDGQQYSSQLQYVPIADLVSNIGLDGLARITYNGEQVYTGPTTVWASDSYSEIIDAHLSNLSDMYDNASIDQATYLQVIYQTIQLNELLKDGLIDDSRLAEGLSNILP